MAFKRLFRDTLIYGSGRVVLQIFAVILVPVWTRVFNPSDYGIIEALATGIAALTLIASLGLESASQRSYFDYSEEEKRSRVLSTALVALLASSAVISALGISFRHEIARELLGSEKYSTLVVLGVLVIPVALLTNFTQEIMRLRHEPWRYTAVSLVSGLAVIVFSLIFVLGLDQHLRGYYLGLLVGSSMALLVGCVLVRKALRPVVDRRELRVMLAYGLPLVPVAASTWVLQLADRFFLLHYSTLRDLGLYGVAYRLANLLLLGTTAFSLAWAPLMLELHAEDPQAERSLRSRTLNYVTFLVAFGAVVLSAYAREIFQTITAPTFADAYKVVGLLAGSIVFIGMNAVTVSGTSIVRRTGYLARYTFYAAVLNIALNFALIPPLGIVGAAVATLVTYGVLAAFYYYRSEKLDPAPFEHRRILLILVMAAVAIAAGTLVHVEPLWLDALVKIPIVLAFPALLLLTRAIEWSSVVEIQSFALEPFRRGETAG
jgi:O-antigen/teichoic acid export membrane protein